jgi:hypothetical protein
MTDRDLATITRERLRRMSLRIDDRSFMIQTGLVAETAEVKYQSFEKNYREALKVLGARRTSRDEVETPHILHGLRSAFVENSVLGIDAQLKFALQGFLANESFTKSDLLNQARLADLRYPYEWYPKARSLERKIHLHVGPTNSGVELLTRTCVGKFWLTKRRQDISCTETFGVGYKWYIRWASAASCTRGLQQA